MAVIAKDPDAALDYGCDWSDWLDDGETISESTWVLPDGLTSGEGAQAPSNTDTATVVWLSGGTAGRAYSVTNRITTSAGRTDDRSIIIRVRQR